MAPSETNRPAANEGTIGLTLRELVLEVRQDVKGVKAMVDTHLLEHAQVKGQAKGEARIFGMARSSVAILVSILSGAAAVWGIVR